MEPFQMQERGLSYLKEVLNLFWLEDAIIRKGDVIKIYMLLVLQNCNGGELITLCIYL